MPITLAHSNKNELLWGKKDFLSKSRKAAFTELVFEMLSEKRPQEKELELFELILKLSIDHGPDTPSAIPVIEAAKNGETISKSLAKGIEHIDDVHGGAGENTMKLFYKIKTENADIEETVREYLKNKIKIPGFGHRLYKSDQRAQLILEKTETLSQGKEYVSLARAIEATLQKKTSKILPINIDGALAAALCALGWKAETAKAVFIIARIPGLCAHYLNNK